MNKVILLMSLLTLSCCGAYKKGNELAKLMYEERSELQMNNLSKNDLVGRYNNPNHRWADRSGNEVYNYQYLEIEPFFYTYIPIISIFIRPSERIGTYDISITFDKNGKIVDSSFFGKEYKH